ncbi:peptidoglycan recognition protein family protein [Streptomyces phaeochromogenes]|uniref:peptidoglycan recognition protein family protein n=1 Tax=Streptomyces phaeochromogenes TaxID=1923 RepID=UPI0036B03AA1
MGERNRYLRLDRHLAERGAWPQRHRRPAPGRNGDSAAASGGESSWPGTADRTPPAEPALVLSTEVSWALGAYDDGKPIDLRYESPAARAETAPPATAAVPAAPQPLPSPTAAPSAPPVPLTPTPGDGLPPHLLRDASDDEFAARIRQLVEGAAGGEPAASPTVPAPPEAAAQAAPPPAPATVAELRPPDADSGRYAVFQSVADSLARPTTFDLGSVSVADAFEALEDAMDREESEASRRAANTRTRTSAPALGPFDVAEDFGLMPMGSGQSTPPPVWRDLQPKAADTVVVDGVESAAPIGLAWRNWTSGSVEQFRGRPQQHSRALGDLRQIVVHETATASWANPTHPKGVQLHIERDGTVIQHNDLVDMLWHARAFSEHSVGIEVVNPVYDTDTTAAETPPGERIRVAWAPPNAGPYYVLPPQVQVEALARAVGLLRERLGIADNWPQIMEHPDPAQKTVLASHWFFLLSTRGHVYFSTMTGEPWTASHSALVSHEDGAFPTLYCYLRLHKQQPPADAYQLARQIVEDPGGHRYQTHYDHASGANLQLLDITDVA